MTLIELAVLTVGNWHHKKSEIVREARKLLGDTEFSLGKDREYLVAIDGLVRARYLRWEGPGMYSTSELGNAFLRDQALPTCDRFVYAIRYNSRPTYSAA